MQPGPIGLEVLTYISSRIWSRGTHSTLNSIVSGENSINADC